MSSPRWHKILADLKVSRSRTILVILSIAIGVFAVGAILTARVALTSGIDDSFDLANPASAVLMTSAFDATAVEAVAALPEIADAQGRAQLDTRILGSGDAWSNLNLHGIADFNDIRIDRLVPEQGAWPPATGELLLERLSLPAGVSVGDDVIVETPDGARHTLRVGGTVYDPSQVDPSIGDGRLSGFISLETMAMLGQPTTSMSCAYRPPSSRAIYSRASMSPRWRATGLWSLPGSPCAASPYRTRRAITAPCWGTR
jgi:putative ABC transport system permease protein